ncbi:U11/U12 small nuclear ribonucleoprotein 25 kDa protein [Aristolochia californica]|uniref:U11/U12 small nuclear ribonucleoprotein 25 kDa protein n=1 Tax=Aristolochia californica TaxID=171875 RepID=UPI0035E033C1
MRPRHSPLLGEETEGMEATASSGSMVTEEAEGASYSCGTSELKKARLQSMLATLLDDPVLADVPRKPSLSDVDTLISLELGSAMKVSVIKMDNTSIEVAVMNSATVKDLKVAIQKKMNETEEAQMGHRHISWRHVWANCYLEYYNEKLTDDNSQLQNFGINNNSQLHFVPCVVSRLFRRHSRRRKHRFFHGLSKR